MFDNDNLQYYSDYNGNHNYILLSWRLIRTEVRNDIDGLYRRRLRYGGNNKDKYYYEKYIKYKLKYLNLNNK